MIQIKGVVTLIAEAAAAPGVRENNLGAWAMTAGLIITSWLGGWDTSLEILLAMMIADFITGILGALKTTGVNSEVMFWGGIRKGTVLLVVGLASLMDEWAQTGAPLFRTAAIYYYVAREGISLVENLGKYGFKLPPPMIRFLEQLSEKEEAKEDKPNGG